MIGEPPSFGAVQAMMTPLLEFTEVEGALYYEGTKRITAPFPLFEKEELPDSFMARTLA